MTTAAFKIFANVSSGFDNLDENLSFTPGLYIFGAEHAMGKTTFTWRAIFMGANKKFQLQPAGNFKITIGYLSRETFSTALDAYKIRNGKVVESLRKNITSNYAITNVKTNGVKFTEFNRAVLNACIAEQAAGNDFTTVARLFHLLGGGKNLTRNMRKALTDSIERLASVRIEVEMEKARNELGYGAEREKFTDKGYLMPTESVETTVNAQLVDAATHFLKKGVIFIVADVKNQIISENPVSEQLFLRAVI